MAEKALFFNALPDSAQPTGYDRNYNADDISDWLDVVMTTGVIKSNTGLKVIPAGGLSVSVNVGKAIINGKPYRNDSAKVFTIDTAPTGSASRIDLIVLRFDRTASVRNTYLAYKKGTGEAIPALIRTDLIYELALARITVAPFATEITAGNIADLRGDAETVVTTTTGQSLGFCPYMTAAKGYDDYYDAIIQQHESTVNYSANPVITTLPSVLYNNKYSLIEVYTNGIKELETAFTVSTSGGYIVITFTAAKTSGAKITVILNNFIDGEGMNTALAQYAELMQDVAELKESGEYDYICNGVNDNILISNIIRTFYSTNDYKSLKLNIIGDIGISSTFGGSGTTVNPYTFFDFMPPSDTNRMATVDFSRASAVKPTISSGSYNIIFRTNKINIIGANVIASNTAADTVVRVSNATTGTILFENCRFWITAYKDSVIGLHGTFNNCRGSVANVTNNSYCFLTSGSGILRINGGEYYAYTGGSSLQSSIIGQSSANAVSILYGVNAPTVERSGFYQTNSILQWTGGGYVNCTDLISALPMIVVSGISNIRGTIPYSKAGSM